MQHQLASDAQDMTTVPLTAICQFVHNTRQTVVLNVFASTTVIIKTGDTTASVSFWFHLQ